MMDLKADPEDADYKRPAPIEVFATRSTLHGISHMFTYERKYVKRSLWIVFFMASLGVLVMVCVDRVQFYFEYPHVTKLDEVAASMIVFPAVTFCNLNSFRFSQVTHNDLYHAGDFLALLNGRYEIRDPHLVEESVLKVLKEKTDFADYRPRPFNMREFYERTGHDIKEMLLSCSYRGTECSAEHFKVVLEDESDESLLNVILQNSSMFQTAGCFRDVETSEKKAFVEEYLRWYILDRNHRAAKRCYPIDMKVIPPGKEKVPDIHRNFGSSIATSPVETLGKSRFTLGRLTVLLSDLCMTMMRAEMPN